MLRRIIALFLSMILLISGCKAEPSTWQEYYDLGVRYLSDGNYEEAILSFTAAIDIDPKVADAYLMRGEAYIKLAKAEPKSAEKYLKKAEKDFATALELDPDCEDDVEDYLEDLDEVREDLDEVQENPDLDTSESASGPSLSFSYVKEEIFHTDGTMLSTLEYPHSAVFSYPDKKIAQTVNRDLVSLCESFDEDAADYRLDTVEEYDSGFYYPYIYNASLTTSRMDNVVLSIIISYWSYSGGVHGYGYSLGRSYDLSTGSVLTLSDILADTSGAAASLQQLLFQKLTELDSGYWFSTPEEIARSSVMEKPENGSWYFTQTGLLFCYAPYEIASYAEGPIAAEISYDLLDGIVKEKYLPDGAAPDGVLRHIALSKAQARKISPDYNLVLDADGHNIALTASGTVANLTISACVSASDGGFYPDYPLFAVGFMAPDETLLLQTLFTEDRPALAISYIGINGPVTQYLTQNDENGYILLDDVSAAITMDNSFGIGKHTYAFFNFEGTWEEAVAYCKSLGGHIATITSQEENDTIFALMLQSGYQSAYFGLTDAAEEGSWVWLTGEDVEYLNWHSGEPNGENSSEDYAMFYYKFNDGTWNDGDFGGRTVNGGSTIICEWE